MSKIEVDAITQQSGSTLTVGGGASKTVVADATTVTLGRCGGTVALASGATQSGFGRTGTVDWQTGSIKTGTFTAANGEGYFVDTSSGAVTANLPAGSAGAIVSFADYTRTFNSNNLTVSPNGSEKIGGVAADLSLTVNGQSLTLVYVDGTEGCINIQNAEDTETGTPPFIQATGGTVTCSGDFKIHTFTGPGTFQVTNISPSAPENALEYVVVAGGGGGGGDAVSTAGGGGGAGGFRFAAPTLAPATYPAKPLAGPAAITAAVQSYPITVGAGGNGGSGSGGSNSGTAGTVSTFSTITSAGGGFGNGAGSPETPGGDGGSGGGARNASAGSGNTPPVSPLQGRDGGASSVGGPTYASGGGGGALDAGSNGSAPVGGGPGGVGGGFPNHFGTSGQSDGGFYYFSGGGGGGIWTNIPGPVAAGPYGQGGLGGGGNGGQWSTQNVGVVGVAGTGNTGGAGGGASGGAPGNTAGGAGGSGIVIIRYKFQ